MAPPIERITDPNDPHRCQFINNVGQCVNKAVDGCEFCYAHGGSNIARNEQKQQIKNYRLGKYKSRISELAESEGIKSLREEIGVLRILLETRLNKINDDQELILQSGPISDLVLKIDKLVTSCHRLEDRMGFLLDKTKVMQFAQVVTDILTRHIDDPEVLELIANEIMEAIV